jgi:HEAT repeat protein
MALVELSRDPNERVRCAAIEHLPFVEDERVFDVLVTQLKKKHQTFVPLRLAHWATWMRRKSSAQLIEGLSDEDVWVRYFSARALGRRR